MAAYIQIWNPDLWLWDTHAAEVRETKKGNLIRGDWSCGTRKHYEIGQGVFIYRVSDNHGIVASGLVTDEPFEGEHWDRSGQMTLYVPIDFDVVLDLQDILPRDRLESEVRFDWRHLIGSGKEVSGDVAAKLEDLWKRHLAAIGRA